MPRTFDRTAMHVRQFICGLHGHDTLFHFNQRHVSLVCAACGYESPGWNVPGSDSLRATTSVRTGSHPSDQAA
jgi:hypothetical protein